MGSNRSQLLPILRPYRSLGVKRETIYDPYADIGNTEQES
jgi:hypothetical protein